MYNNTLTPPIRFSVVIPTRQRPNTLKYTLRTCLVQNFDSYEIVVCDNCSSPETIEAVEACASPKIKYVRTDVPLAMSRNWELAVSHASGEFVLLIGDDDGLLPGALLRIDTLLRRTQLKALHWERVYYSWPDLALKEHANELYVPLGMGYREIRTAQILHKIANNQLGYTLLPMLYNAVIHRDLLASLQDKAGCVFGAQSPDIYSGFALAYLAEVYGSVNRPITINAGSASSNGVAHIHLKGRSLPAKEFELLSSAQLIDFHPLVPRVPCMASAIADAFQQAKDRLFPHDRRFYIVRKQMIVNCINELRPRTGDAEEWGLYLKQIQESLADDRGLQRWFERNYMDRDYQPQEPQPNTWDTGFDGHSLRIKATDFGITDVYGVAEFCGKILPQELDPPFVPLWKRLLRRVQRETVARVRRQQST